MYINISTFPFSAYAGRMKAHFPIYLKQLCYPFVFASLYRSFPHQLGINSFNVTTSLFS